VEEEAFGEEKILGKEKALCLCKLVEEERCGRRRTRKNRTNLAYFFKMFPQFHARAHYAKKPGTLPSITVTL